VNDEFLDDDRNDNELDDAELHKAKNSQSIYIAVSVACIVTVCVLLANKIDPGEIKLPNLKPKSPTERITETGERVLEKGADVAVGVIDRVLDSTTRSNDGKPSP